MHAPEVIFTVYPGAQVEHLDELAESGV